MKFSCEKCGRSYVADEKVRGRAFKMKCKQCGNLIVVKSAAAASPTPLPGSIPPVSPPARSTTPPALELEGKADPFASTSADPFAPPAGDPFAVPSPDPFTPATSVARASFDPFVEAPPEPAYGANGASAPQHVAPPPVDEADAAFADLSREMASDDEAPIERGFAPIAPEPVVAAPPPPLRRVEIPAPVMPPPVAAPPRRVVARPAPTPAHPPAKRSSAPLIGAGLALVVVVGVGGWLFLKSDKPEPKPLSSPPPPVAARASETATQRDPSPPHAAAAVAPPVQAATAGPEQNAEKPLPAPAEEPRDDARAAKHRPAEKSAPPPKKKEVARVPEPVKPPPQKAVPPPAPEPPRQDAPKVAIAPKSAPVTSTAPVNTAFGRTNPAAPPVSTNADLPPLDEAKVEATFAKYARNLDACVAMARDGDQASALNGRTVNVTMTVNPNGKVLYPTLDDVELNGTDLGKCLKKESGRIQFPAFGGEPIRVRKPIVLK